MDLSALIVVIMITALFIGFIVWLGIYSRRTAAQKLPGSESETGFGKE